MTEPKNGIVPGLEAKIRQLEAERAILLASIDKMMEDDERETTMTPREQNFAQLAALADRLSKDENVRLAHAGDSLGFALALLDDAQQRLARAEKSAEHYRIEFEQLQADVPRIVGDALMAVRRG